MIALDQYQHKYWSAILVTQANEFIFRGQDLNFGSILLENTNFATKSSVWGVFSLFSPPHPTPPHPKTDKQNQKKKRIPVSETWDLKPVVNR